MGTLRAPKTSTGSCYLAKGASHQVPFSHHLATFTTLTDSFTSLSMVWHFCQLSYDILRRSSIESENNNPNTTQSFAHTNDWFAWLTGHMHTWSGYPRSPATSSMYLTTALDEIIRTLPVCGIKLTTQHKSNLHSRDTRNERECWCTCAPRANAVPLKAFWKPCIQKINGFP